MCRYSIKWCAMQSGELLQVAAAAASTAGPASAYIVQAISCLHWLTCIVDLLSPLSLLLLWKHDFCMLPPCCCCSPGVLWRVLWREAPSHTSDRAGANVTTTASSGTPCQRRNTHPCFHHGHTPPIHQMSGQEGNRGVLVGSGS
jgi:hypothetical protein